MATDFFERQDVARRNTTRLVVLFALAVLAIIVSIDLLLAATMGYLGRDPLTGAVDWTLAADPQLVLLAVVGTLVVVGGGSLYKVAQLRAGGHVIAEELGGRRLDPGTAVPSEQQLLNVVEEMAIASGTPVPQVYLLDREDGINAVAAGFSPGDAVIGVTRGAAEQLTRDELQGVIAHEFSHILNGDMRLNIRLVGLLHGILIIGFLGYFVLRMGAASRYRGRSRQEGSQLPILALGAGLMAVGFFGTLFGNMIKAAASRQREFLADASAVQFTRQPEGLAGALKKIGGAVSGSAIQSPNAPEASHLFFGRATSGFSGLFSTHPKLGERIRRLDPSWDGTFPELPPAVADAIAAPPARTSRPTTAGVSSLAGSGAAAAGIGQGVRRSMDEIGQPREAHIQYAARLVGGLPSAVVTAAHEPHGARAVVYALLLDRKAAPRQAQLAHLADAADLGVYEETLRLEGPVARLDVQSRLPLVEMTLPALRTLTAGQYTRFKENVNGLVLADDAIDPFEWSLHRILLHELEVHHAHAAPARVRYHALAPLAPQCELLLSVLARAGQRDAADAETAFEQGYRRLNIGAGRFRQVDTDGFVTLDGAMAALNEAAPPVKRQILQGAVACITADDTVTATEAELLRAFSVSMGCPMPPILPA